MPIDYSSELTDLRRAIMTMGAGVEQRINMAVTAVIDGDIDAAQTVRRGDDEIDRMEIDIEQTCLRVLALSQPMVSDLRMVLAIMRISGILERVGDLARSVAKRAIDLHNLQALDVPAPLVSMAGATRSMFADAMQALADREAGLARRVRAADQRVDDLQREVFAWAQLEIPRHVEWTAAAIDVLSVARKLERIADLSTTIAEEIIFLVEGSVVRHT
ncbi:MAG: phosphate signaling complex protein PhoU [Phycisphaerales bacterium]|nr:phosphate signaling complex protein PhoU [Phycisphaerales bacterium]